MCAYLEELWVEVVHLSSVCSMPQSSGMHERDACASEGEVREKTLATRALQIPNTTIQSVTL